MRLTLLILILAAALAAVAPSPCAALTIAGSLTAGSPAWNRIKDNGVTGAGTCAASAPDSFNNGVPYKTFILKANAGTMLSATVTAPFDSFLTLHCQPINASQPAAGLMAADDDSGGYPHAALAASLQSDQTYYLTVSSYQGTPTDGAFSLTVGGDVTVILPTVTLSSASVAENLAPGAVAGTLGVANPVAGETYIYTRVAGTGSTDNDSFTISDSQILTAAAFNYEAKSSYSVRVRATGSLGSIAEAQFTVAVTNVNEAPTANGQSVTISEDALATPIVLTGGDPDGAVSLTYAIVAGPSHGTLGGSGANRTYKPDANYSGSDFFTFTVSDGSLTSSAATASITVTSVDDAPTATAQSVTTNEDAPLTITLAGTDPENNPISAYAVVSGPSHGTLSDSGASRTYTPAQDFNGPDSFTFTVTANGQTSPPATVSITVNPVNDPPVIGGSPAAEVFKGQTYGFTPTASDPDAGATLTWSIANKPGWASFNTATGQLSGVPAKSQVGAYPGIVIGVSDGALSASLPAFTIVVRDVNDAPTAITLTSPGSVTRNAPVGTVVGRLVAADPDAGDSFTFALVSGAGDTDNGFFAIQGDMLVTALAIGDETQASRSARVRVTDSGGLTMEQSFDIQIREGSASSGLLRYLPAIIKRRSNP